jgi:hypothetical protein
MCETPKLRRASLAQSVERTTLNRVVAGSSPAGSVFLPSPRADDYRRLTPIIRANGAIGLAAAALRRSFVLLVLFRKTDCVGLRPSCI